MESDAAATPESTAEPTVEPTETPVPEPTIAVEASNALAKYKFEGGTLTFYDGGLITEELLFSALEEYGIGDYDVSKVVIEEGIVSIGENAFYCWSMENLELPDSVTSIGENAFSNCPKLTKVTFPASVTSIGEDAFTYEPELYNISAGSIVVSAPAGSYAESWAKENYYMSLSGE